jgi:hypothetical protein
MDTVVPTHRRRGHESTSVVTTDVLDGGEHSPTSDDRRGNPTTITGVDACFEGEVVVRQIDALPVSNGRA